MQSTSSCSGQNFSIRSPDCKAQMSIQSNRPLQVESMEPSASIISIPFGANDDQQLATSSSLSRNNWLGLSPEQQQQQRQQQSTPTESLISISTSPTTMRLLQIQPTTTTTTNLIQDNQQQQQQLGSNTTTRFYTTNQRSSSQNSNYDLVDQDESGNYTLIVLDCSPHPHAADGSDQVIDSSGSCHDCSNKCHCQTELIVRQQIEHDHACQHSRCLSSGGADGQMIQQQQQLMQLMRPEGSGSMADRSASLTTTIRSRSQTQEHDHLDGGTNRRSSSRENYAINSNEQQTARRQPQFDEVDIRQTTTTTVEQQQQQPKQATFYENYAAFAANQQPQPSSNYGFVDQPTRRQQQPPPPQQPNYWQQQQQQQRSQPSSSNETNTMHTATTTTKTTRTTETAINENQENIEPQYQRDYRNERPQQEAATNHDGPERAKTNNKNKKLVKRWNWNKAQFVEEEVPVDLLERQKEEQISRALHGRRQQPTSSSGRPTDAWHTREAAIQSISSTLSPIPPQQFDPSWLAYRVPDEQSVQADPLYRDLMLELQRLEQGVVTTPTDGAQPSTTYQQQQQFQSQLQQPSIVIHGSTPESPIVFSGQQQQHEEHKPPSFGQPLLPESLEINEYENAEFLCRLIPQSFAADPDLSLEWTLNGRPLLEGSRITCEHEFGVARLLIRRCEAEDSGLYECRARNAHGEATTRARLKVNAKNSIQCETLHPMGLQKIRQLENPKPVVHFEEPQAQQAPKFLTHIKDYLEKDEGESVHFECCLSPVDDPDLKTEWFFNGRPLVTGSRFHTIEDFGFIVLDIAWLFPHDTGEYVCRATNKFGADLTRTVLRVRPAKSIILDSQLENGGEATIDKLRRLEFPEVAPEHHYEEPEKPAHFVQALRCCSVQAAAAALASGQPHPVELNNQINRRNVYQFQEGDNVHFDARVGPATDGQLTVEWFHNGRSLISGHRFKPTFDFGHIQLDILYVYPEDSGLYKCVARNEHGQDESQLEIFVTGKPSLVYQSQLPAEMVGGVQKITDMEAMWNRAPDPEEDEPALQRVAPEFVLAPKPYTAFENSCARFCCRLLAHPRPRVTWFINNQQVVSGLRYKLTYDGMYHLIIPKCQLSDAGLVRVVARNLLGECSSETELSVKRKLDDYRGVLKNSPNPWYDEATLRTYRRQRNQQDNDDDQDYGEFLEQFQRQQQLHKLQVQQAAQANNLALENQLVGYMEPETPDINLLAGGALTYHLPSAPPAGSRSPLVEPGDLHPLVMEQQVVMAPAPSTIQRALNVKDSIRDPEHNFHQLESVENIAVEVGDTAENNNDHADAPDQQRQQADSSLAARLHQDDQNAQHEEEQQQQRVVFGLNSARRGYNQPPDPITAQQVQRQQQQPQQQQQRHQRSIQQEQGTSSGQDQQAKTSTTATLTTTTTTKQRLPPPSPENSEFGKEFHTHTSKQLQVERRANKEITREIIEREIFEQEHKGFSKENCLSVDGAAESSAATRRSPTPDQQHLHTTATATTATVSSHSQPPQAYHNQWQQRLQQQQQQQQSALIEDYMIPPEFTQKIQPCQAIDGDEARFECRFRGDPIPSITWYRESQQIRASSSNLYQIETDLKELKSTLIIKRVTLHGNAVYTVKAENVAGSAKSSANLVVEAHPLPSSSSRSGHARQVDSIVHASSGGAGDVRGETPSVVVDQQQQQLVDVLTMISNESGAESGPQNGAQSKVVKSVRTRRLSPDELATLIRASPEGSVAPTFLHTIYDTHARPGDLVRLDARLIGSQPMEVRWLKNQQRVRPDKSHKLLLEGDLYTLLILECHHLDEGHYECVASNSVGESRCAAYLRIGNEPAQSPFGPMITMTSMASSSSSAASQQQSAGSAFSSAVAAQSGLSSQATTTTTTKTYQQQQQQMAAGSNRSTAADRLQAGQRTHFGLTKQPHHQLMSQYTSSSGSSGAFEQAGGGGGHHLHQQQQSLIPKLIKRLESQQVREGKPVTLRCQISAHPKAEVFWFKHNDKPIKPSKYFRIYKDNDETHCLKILEVFPEDQGEYKCQARAQHGFVETVANIQVIPNSPK